MGIGGGPSLTDCGVPTRESNFAQLRTCSLPRPHSRQLQKQNRTQATSAGDGGLADPSGPSSESTTNTSSFSGGWGAGAGKGSGSPRRPCSRLVRMSSSPAPDSAADGEGPPAQYDAEMQRDQPGPTSSTQHSDKAKNFCKKKSDKNVGKKTQQQCMLHGVAFLELLRICSTRSIVCGTARGGAMWYFARFDVKAGGGGLAGGSHPWSGRAPEHW